MISTPVRVIAVKDGVAQVAPTAQSGCGGCASREACGVSGLGKLFSTNRKAVEVPCDTAVHAGDELQVQMSEGDLLKAGMLAYMLPSLLALAGAVLANVHSSSDAMAVLGAAAGASTGFIVARFSGWRPRLFVQSNSKQGETP